MLTLSKIFNPALASVPPLIGALSHALRVCRFNSCSGHKPWLRVPPADGVRAKGNQSVSLSLLPSFSPSLPSSFSKGNERMSWVRFFLKDI